MITAFKTGIRFLRTCAVVAPMLMAGAGMAAAEARPSCGAGQFARGDTCVSHQAIADAIRKMVTDTIKRDDLNAVIVSVKLGDTRVVHQAWGETMTGIPADDRDALPQRRDRHSLSHDPAAAAPSTSAGCR